VPKHDIKLKVEQEIPIQNTNVVFPVDIDGTRFGRLRISKGGVDWMDKGSQKKHQHLTWKRIAELIKQHGDPVD
jgi:hypothetical protein